MLREQWRQWLEEAQREARQQGIEQGIVQGRLQAEREILLRQL